MLAARRCLLAGDLSHSLLHGLAHLLLRHLAFDLRDRALALAGGLACRLVTVRRAEVITELAAASACPTVLIGWASASIVVVTASVTESAIAPMMVFLAICFSRLTKFASGNVEIGRKVARAVQPRRSWEGLAEATKL